MAIPLILFKIVTKPTLFVILSDKLAIGPL